MKYSVCLNHYPPADAALRKKYYAAKEISRPLPLEGRALPAAVEFLERMGYTFRADADTRGSKTEYTARLFHEFTREDWAKCELFEAQFDRLADDSVDVHRPLPMDGGARVLLETTNMYLPEFVLAGAYGFAFVRDRVKKEMERERFAGLTFRRAGVLGFKRGEDEIESGAGPLLRRTPGTGEKFWQLRSTVTLPAPVQVPVEKRTHRPLAGRADLSAGLRMLGSVDERLVFTRSSLATVGSFDIAVLPHPPKLHMGKPSGSPPRVVVSRRLKDWLTERLRPAWKAEELKAKMSGSSLGISAEGHETWNPVAVVEV